MNNYMKTVILVIIKAFLKMYQNPSLKKTYINLSRHTQKMVPYIKTLISTFHLVVQLTFAR